MIRAAQRIVMGLGLVAVVVTVIDGGFGVRRAVVVLLVSLVVGALAGLVTRRTTTLDQRLRAVHQLNPKLARRFLPDPDDPIVKAKSKTPPSA